MDYINSIIENYVRSKALEKLNEKYSKQFAQMEISYIAKDKVGYCNSATKTIMLPNLDIPKEYEEITERLRTQIYNHLSDGLFAYLDEVVSSLKTSGE